MEKLRKIDLSSPIQYLKGVGPVRARKFRKLGVETVEDLLWFMPRRYEDRSKLSNLSSLEPGETKAFLARVVSIEERKAKRRNLTISTALLTDGSSFVQAVWFNRPGLKSVLEPGTKVAVYGKIEIREGIKQVNNGEFEVLDEDSSPENVGMIVPVYPGTQGLVQKWIRKIVKEALRLIEEEVEDPLPIDILTKYDYPDFFRAIKEMHFPSSRESWLAARNRLAFQELFLLQLGLAVRRRSYVEDNKGHKFNVNGPLVDAFIHKVLPFKLTDAQKRVFSEIRDDVSKEIPMNRLLQGDVGSGKTVIAILFMLCAIDSGYQAAFMAPTEVLAKQHFEKIHKWLTPLGVKVSLLTGSVPSAEKRIIYEEVSNGLVNIVVGTHALIQDNLAFRNLGAVVIDEQHRFGVLQRGILADKGEHPHVLVMTATPIPRTLTLSVYGDLSVSVIDEMPPGRKDIITKSVKKEQESELLSFLKEEIKAGGQVYWICPMIDENEELSIASAESRFSHLRKIFKEETVALLHGKKPYREKEQIMSDFEKGHIDVLVSTTVIEVGIDVPNATVMVIEDPWRFGLSQLHQLRGRVGRGNKQGYCFLLGRPDDYDGKRKIAAMCSTNDGFKIAEADLAIRGPGEVCGTRQHGVTDFRVANLLRDRKILNLARKEAFSLIEKDPKLEGYPKLKELLLRQLGDKLDLVITA
ncbi:MAG: ATP-dependent helicase RecG [Thermovirga sp.]|nr:ATP-dependent helicase RecG [Thermovirga sp.]